MAKILPLSSIARLVAISSLLDDKDTSLALCRLLATDFYSAVSESILKKLTSERPDRLTNELLTSLCPPYIRSLSLNSCSKITVTGIAGVLSKCSHLASLNLSCCDQLMHSAFFTFLAKCMGRTLTSLTLENNQQLMDDHVRTILLQCAGLKSLNVSSTDITNDAFNINPGQHQQMKPSCSLESIDISGCQYLDIVAVSLITKLFGTTLRSINLSFTEISCPALCFLAGYNYVDLPQLRECFAAIEAKHERKDQEKLKSIDKETNTKTSSGESKQNNGLINQNKKENGATHLHQVVCLEENEANSIEATGFSEGNKKCHNHEKVVVGNECENNGGDINEINAKHVTKQTLCVDNDVKINVSNKLACSNDHTPDVKETKVINKKDNESQKNDNTLKLVVKENSSDFQTRQSCTLLGSSSSVHFTEELLCKSMQFVYNCPAADDTLSSPVCDILDLSSIGNTEDKPSSNANNDRSPGNVEKVTTFITDVGRIVSHNYCSNWDIKSENSDTDSPAASNNQGTCDNSNISHSTANSNFYCDKSADESSEASARVPCDICGSEQNVTTGNSSTDLVGVAKMMPENTTNKGDSYSHQQLKLCKQCEIDVLSESTQNVPEQIFTPCLNSVEISCINYKDKATFDLCLKLLFLTNPNIQKFRISYHLLSDEVAEYIVDHAPRLNHVALCECEALTSQGIATVCHKCPNLTYLNLHGVCFIQDPALFPLWSLKRITYLNLAESNVTDISLRMMAQHATQLEQVDLSWCEELMADENTEAMISFLKSGESLQSLRLRHLPLSDYCVIALAQNCVNLQRLNLSSVACLQDSHVLAISLRCTQMREINVSWNSALTDVSASSILRHLINATDVVLSGIKQLTSKPFLPIIADVSQWRRSQALLRLKLHEKQMLEETGDSPVSSDEEFEELFIPHRSTSYAPNLRSLDLEYCDKLNDTHLAEISAVCRGTLKITDYYGSPIEPCYIACQKGKVYKAVQFFG